MNKMPYEKRSFGRYLKVLMMKQALNDGDSVDHGNIFNPYKTVKLNKTKW